MEWLKELCPDTEPSVPDSVPESGTEYGALHKYFHLCEPQFPCLYMGEVQAPSASQP